MTKVNAPAWTKDDQEQLRKMVTSGVDPDQIARHLGRTKAAVLTRASLIGVNFNMLHREGHTPIHEDYRALVIDESPLAAYGHPPSIEPRPRPTCRVSQGGL